MAAKKPPVERLRLQGPGFALPPIDFTYVFQDFQGIRNGLCRSEAARDHGRDRSR